MPFFLSTAMRFYKLCAVIGLLIIIATILLSWTQLQQLENNVSLVFEEIVTVNLEVTGLKTELQHIDRVLQQADQSKGKSDNITVDEIPYSAYEIERLRTEKMQFYCM
jgi:hypothetical protein